MANNLEILYNSLKRDNYDVPATYESFARTLTASGMEGVRNRQALYNSLRNDDYDVPDTYESFATTLFVPAMSRQSGNGISEAQAQRTGSGGKSTSRGDLVQTASTSRGEADSTVGTPTEDAAPTEGTALMGDIAQVGNVAPAGHVMTPSERLRVARHNLEATQAAMARTEEERKARQAEKDYYKAVREEEELIRERNAEGRARADAEGIDWNAVPNEGETEVRYDDLLSEQAQVKRLANTAGYLGPHLDKEGARAVSSDIGEGVYYHRDGRTSQEREPFAAHARAMNDPEDIYRTPAGGGIDPRGASADPIALPELEVTGSSRGSIMKRVDEMRFLDESLKDVSDVELRKRASVELQSERDEVDARLEKWKEENPGKWRDMSREDRAGVKAGFADDVQFERFMSGIDARIAANEREQQRRMSEIERQVREDLSKTPEGRRLLKEPDSDMDIRRRVELAAGYDSEIRALRQESWNLGEMRNAKLAAESDGGRESLWNFAKGVGRGLREIVENPLGLRSMHNDATQLMRVFGKLQEGEALTDTEQRAVESHFTRQMDDTHYDMSQSAKAGEFTAALAEIAVEFGLNPASGAVRRVLTGIAREVGPAAVRATVMNAPALLYKLGVSSTEIGARAFAGNIAKMIGAAIGEGAGATFSTQLAKNLEESVNRAISMPVYDAQDNLAGLAGDSFGSAAAKTFTTSAGTNAVFMLPAHFGGEAMKGLGRFAEYVDQRGMGIPFGNPVDALVKMKSGEIIGVIASDVYGRSLGDPTMGDVFSEESAKEMIIGLLAAEFTTGGMKFAGRQIKGSTLDMAIIKNEAEVRRAAAKMAASLKNQDGAVDAEGLRILEMVMGADASMDPGVIGNCLKTLAESGAPQETRQAALDYLRASYRWRGSVARREQWRESGKEQDWRDDQDVSTSRIDADPTEESPSRRDAARGKEVAPDGDQPRDERTLVAPKEVDREKARQRADEALRGGYEAVDPEIRAEMQRNAESAVAGIYERFEHPEDVMEILDGIEDAEGLIKEVHENEYMNAPQKEAAEAYVLSSMAERGMSMRREDDRVKAREDIREDVGRMSTPDGMLRPVTLKRDDRQVMVLSGEIVLSDDGSTVLPSESSSVLWIYDPATGAPRAAAPEEILSVGPVMTAEAEIERRIKELEAIEAQAESQEVMFESQSQVTGSEVETAPSVSTSRRDAAPDVEGTEERDKADAVYERALAAREGLEDAFSDNPEFWLNEVHENPEAVLSDPEIPDFQKDAVREYLEAMKALEEEDGKETNSKAETPSVPGMPENVPNSTENIVSEGKIAPEAVSNVENGQQTALSRIPTNGQGEPKFEAVDKDTAWDGLVEAVGGEADAADIAMAQVQQASTELEALKKKPPTLKAPKLQGSPMAMAQAKRKANEQYQRELSQYDQQIAEAQTRLDAWNGIVGVYKSRYAPRNHEQPVKRETNQRESADDRSMEDFFGPVYTEFQGNGNKAEAYLREKCEGVAKGALTYPGIAPIDLAWGDIKAGYMKIVIKHPEVVGKLQELLDQCMITNRSDNRIVLESDTHKFVVSKMKGSTPTDNWLLTAYQKKEKPASASSSDIETEPGGKRNGTATPQNGLYGKVNALSADKQADSVKSSEESPSRRDAAPNSTSGKDASRLGGETSGNISKKEVVSSEENDENGRPFVLADDGTTSFGHIDEESGLTAAPIKLSEGFQDEVTGQGYGLIHIEVGHGEQIRAAGFKSVKDFVSFVAKNYDRDNIRVGKRRPNGSGTFLIQVTDRHDNTLFIELSKDGSYWNVNSGGIFRKGYSNKKETVAKTEPQQPDNAVSGGSSLSKGSQTGISPSEPNGKPTVSTGKVNTLSTDKQADSAESSGESPSRRDAVPNYESTSRRDAAPDESPSRKRNSTGIDKEIRAAAEEMRDCPEALEILSNMDPQDIYEAASVVLATNRVLLSDAQGAIGAKREMGLGRIEQKKYFGLFASAEKGGKSIQKLSEDAMQELCAQYGIPYDNMDARNALLEILQSHSTRGEIGNYIRNRRLEQARKIYRDWENMLEAQEERAAWEAYGMTLADLDAYNEMRDADAKEHLQDLDEREYNATFADIYAQREEEYDRRAKESVGSGDGRGIREITGYESSGERSLSGRGDEVLSGEKSYKASGIEADERSGIQSGDGSEGPVETDGVSAGASGIANKITEAGRLVNTDPTEAQKEAGNYRMGHVWVDGHNITIENPKGSVRRGVDGEGKPWEIRMNNTYGYILGTQSVDGDHIDVFLSDTPEEGDVFVVDQVNEDGSFDEHKVMYGFPTEHAARDAYLSNYEPGWTGLGAITHVSKDEFKKWIGSSRRKTKPFAEYKSVKPIRYDSQGNPIDENGNLIIEDVESVADITDADFTEPTRTIGLPALPEIVQHVLSTNGKKVIIKKNIFGRNALRHDELTPEVSRAILNEALYNPTLYGKNKPLSRPNNWIVINVPDGNGNNKLVVLEVNENKDNVEIVHWHEVDNRGLEKIKRQAEREDGQLLILPSESSEEAGALSGPTLDSPNEKLSPSSEMRLTETPSDSDGPDLAPTSDNIISSDGKDNTLSADKQTESVESSEPYTITPAVYVGKSRGGKPGKETPMHRVTFNRPLTAEQERAVRTFANESIGEKKGRFATKRGWADREAADGSWLFRTEEDARKAGEMIGNEEAVADSQPMTAEELREAVAPAEKKPARKPKKAPINRVSLEDVMTDLSTKGETKLSDHAEPVKAEPEQQHEISDEEMQSLLGDIRDILGIGEDEGDTNIKFRDPGELTPQERMKLQSAGIRVAMALVERGTISFPDYATKMVGLLGDKIRPWLKSFYEGTRWTPGYDKYTFTPTEQVATFDVQNFDKKQADPIAQAAMIVEERKAGAASAQAQKELTETRNKNRRENDWQTEADTAALAEKAEAVAGEAEVTAQNAGTGEAGRKRILRDLKRVDDTLEEVNDQLALLGYYEAKEVDKDFNEAYGYMRNAEKKAVKDAVDLAKQLVNDLGLGLEKVTGATTANRGKRKNAVTANIAPAGGDISIRLPLNEGRELYITIGLDPSVTPGDVTYSGDNLQATRIMYRVEWPDEKGHVSFDRMGRNCWADVKVTYADLLKGIQREAKEYLPESSAEQRKSEISHNGYKVGDEVMWDRYGNGKWEKVKIEDFDADGSPIFEAVKGIMSEKGDWSRVKPADGIFGEAQRVARAEQEKKKKSAVDEVATPTGNKSKKSRKKDVTLKPEQPIGDLFGGLFDNPQNSSNHEETEMGTRPGEAGGQRQQLKQDTQVGGNEPRRETERPAREAGSGSTRMDSDADRAGGRGLHDVATQPALERLPEKERKNVHNNHVERGTEVAPKSESARIKANIAAIETMKKLEASGEAPTAADMKKLRAFSGWGGLGKAFSDWDTSRQLRQLLGDKLYDEGAEMSRNSAYFTPAYIVDAMWDIARAMGFKGGRVLEGSAGIGNVLGLMPQELSERSYIRAVEKDPTTGKMLSLLYPDAVVDIDGFEKVKIETGTYDLVITNVPFVPGLKVADTSGDADISKEFKTSIHDFCIAKNVRKLRDGGVGVFITTAGSMDGTGRLYKWLANHENADIVGMFRMHNETFGGTNATSDIIVVRKRVNGVKSPHAIDCSLTTGVRTAEYNTGETKKVKNVGEVPIIKTLSMSYNRYYVEHPEYMAGEMHFGFEKGDTSFRPESKGLYPVKEKDQSQLLSQWVENMKRNLADTAEETASTVMNHRDEYVPTYDKVGNEVKTGTIVVDSQGRICVNYDGTARPLMSKLDNKSPKSADERIAQFNKNKVKGRTRAQVVQDYNAIKKALNDLLEYQKASDSDEGLQPKLKALNRAFDSFVATYGHLHGNNGLAWLKNDVDYPSVIALETYREEGLEHKKVFGKADIFSRRVVVRPEQPKATNVRDGVTLSIRQTGSLDTRYIAEQLGMNEADVRREVIDAGLGYENPLTHSMEAAHEYLSGNVREKMQQAEANNEDGRYTPNITALRKVVPHSIPSHFIEFSMGSSWLRPELFEQYVKERTGASVKLTYAGGMWAMDKPRWTGEQDKSFGIRSEICDKVITGTELIEAAMTNRTIRVSKQQKDGPTISDPKATSACAAKVDEIRDDFKSWLRSRMEADPELAKEIEERYNDIFNNSAPMTIPDEYIPEYFDGAARVIGGKPIKMRKHQAKAIVRGTMQSLMLAHEVGTGKTFTLITTAMEMRRLGTAKKPMIVVQNATLGQFVASAKALYPDARILSLEDKDRNAEGRKDFYAKIRYNDWDMVVIPQSVLERIPDHPDRERRFIEESIQEKMDVIEAMSKDREAGRAVAALKKDVENLRDQLNKLSDTETAEGEVTERVMATPGSKPKKDGKRAAIAKENAKTRAEEMLNRATDDTLNFDDLGVDAILVDEAHEYKHLGFATAMQRGVKGVDPSYSKKCQGLYLKVKAVQEKSAGRNVIFATGTPISNTAAEVWTFMRYLLPREVMEGHNIWHFDDFVRNFGSIQQMLEFTTQGTYKENNRFAGYSNLPELARIWAGITDTVLTAEAGEVKSQIPELEGGQPTDLYLPQTNGLRAVLKFVRAQLKAYDEMSGQEKKENSHIPLVIYGIAKAAAIDARLVMANAPDDTHSKTNEAVRQTLRSLEDSKTYNGTVAIFADNYQRKNKETGAVEFNLFDDIRTKLIAQGVPAEQVVIMRDGMTDKAKERIFAKVNAGEIRVILGTTQRLGVGVNIQERLHTLMHIDAPNRPMDYWQRMGRLLRQGNMHKEMGIPVRVIRFGVEDSLDVTAYQRLKTKGAIADAIMHSKDLLANNLENRILEEEGDEFGNITAELSGSQYAMLQNQTEKELRKLQAKQDQYRQHQMYIHRAEPRLREAIDRNSKNIVRSDEILALLENNPTTITINGKTYQSREDMQKVFEAHNKAMAAKKQSVQQNEPITSTLTFDIGNVHFILETNVNQIAGYGGQGTLSFDTDVRHKVISYDIDFERSFGDIPLKRIINELVDNVTNGKEERSNREAWANAKERAETDLAALLKDKGKPFEHGERIKELEQKLEEYTIAMQEELREKEAKYAEMDANIEDARDITFTSEDDEDSADTPATGEVKFRDGQGVSKRDRLRAIRALEPVAVKRNNLSRAELREIYNNLPSVEKDGREIEFYRSAFKKIYKDGGLFGQVVPVLDDVLEQSVLAYSEEDNLGGMVRPDGTVHKEHPNVDSFDNYVGKVSIEGKEYYVRTTVQHSEKSTTGTHSFMVTQVEVYEKTANALSLPITTRARGNVGGDNATESRTIPISSRETTDFDGIVDAKLQQFFERASAEADKLDMRDRAVELSEKLNTPIRIVTDESELSELSEDGKPRYSRRERRAKGWWNGPTGEIVIVLPNNRDIADVDNTVVHEVVGHKGLRALVGEERFDEFLGEIYDHASNSIRKVIDKMTDDMVNAEADRLRVRKAQARERAGEDVNANYYTDMAEARVEADAKRGDFRKEATEEYMADLGGRIGSEGFTQMSRDELSFWGKIKAKVQSFLDKFLRGLKIAKSIQLTDKDLSYILYKSWRNMRDGKSSLRSDHDKGGVFAEAEDVAMRMRTGWGMDPLRSMTEAEKRERRKERTADRIEELFDQAVKGDLTGKPVEVGKLTPEGKEYLEKLSGVKLKDEVSFVLNPSDLAHINRRHFGDNETDARNIPLTKEDIRSIGKILNAPDRIVYGKETVGNQRSMFFFLKETEDGSYNLMEVYSDRKGNLTAKSFFKSKEGVSQRAMLLNESSTLTSVTDGATLLSDANLPKFFEYPKSGDEDGIVRFRDPDMGLEETITKMKTEAMLANADNLKTKYDAMRAIGGNLSHLRQAMTRQKDYDISTVKSVTDLARILMDAGLLDGISKYETKRILSAIDNVVGKQDVSRYVQRVMDIMVGNQLRNRADAFGKLLSVRGSRVDARGIEVQGILDPDGQRIAQVVRKSTTLPKDDIDNRIAEAVNSMSNPDQAIADEATLEYAGLQIARQYVEDITESKAEEKALRDSIREAKEAKDVGQMTEDAYRQYVESTENAIRQNKIERAEAYQSLLEHMGGILSESVKRAKAWREAEKERVNKIHHYANSDMEGRPTDEHHKDDRMQKLANNSGVRFLLAPLATFDQMLRMFGKKNTRGEGYLWNHYMRGWVNATEKEYTGYRDALKALDAKVKEVFGKSSLRSDHDEKQGAGYDKGVKVKCWGDLFTLDRKLPKGTVRFFDGGEMKDHELTQGNLLYIYMADKMSDGRMKLRYMGITEDDVKEIKNLLDPRFIELADWMQEEFLVDKRNWYNEVHKRMFGTSMAAIENYFPLKILANARLENVDVADDTTDTALPATSTGSIIKRRRNNLALDVTGANAFSVILDHLQQMERWAAFAEFNRDLNTLLSYKRFRNQVMNMSSVYGGGKMLWNNFRNVCSMAAGAYRPPIAALDKAAINIAKGVTAAKVSFRMFTALKQFLSMPAYIPDSNPVYLAANIANPYKAWKWSMENLPLFEKRWSSRMAGDPRLLKSDMDWKMWRSRVVEIASRVGMSPNAFVDALTVSIGARSMYQTKLAKYKRMGYGENEADKRAKQDATILFNQTQQSSESAFLSTMQVDRSWLSVLFTVFRNSSMSYTRQLYDALRNIKRRLTPDYKGLSEEFMAKQMVRDGIDPEKASENARREYRRGIIRDFVRVGIFGSVLQLAWNLGAYLPYLILGEDDEEKDNMWQDVWNHTMFGSVEGLTGGDVMSAAGNMWVSGEGNPQYLTKDMPLASDVLSILKKMDKDQVSAMNDVINLLAQSTVGVNPQSLTDAVVAVMDYCGDNAETSRECALLIARILNCPPSQLDKIYFDELDADGREAARMTPAEIAERYAEYKIMKEAPVTGWMRSDAERDSVSAKKQKRVLTEAKSRIGKRLATEETRRLLAEYDSVTKRESEINKMKAEDKDAYRKARAELRESTDMRRHARLRRYKHDMKELTQKYLRTKDRRELEELVRLMTTTRDKMLEDISEIEYKRKGA